MKTNNELREVKGFWDGETCEYCDGTIRERRVELYRHKTARRLLFENVPAGICTACGARYFSANILKMLERMSHSPDNKRKTVQIPVLHFS
jgi:YgiT-type zinc finger domain-containing protein